MPFIKPLIVLTYQHANARVNICICMAYVNRLNMSVYFSLDVALENRREQSRSFAAVYICTHDFCLYVSFFVFFHSLNCTHR